MKIPILILLFLTKILAQEDPCLKNPDPGLCNAFVQAYFYNTTTKSCQTFIWGGCGGTIPFTSLTDCQIAQCDTPKCQQLPNRGPCRAIFSKYFYNQTSATCQQFIWGGCRGNVPFDTFHQCENACTDPCFLKPIPGPCGESIIKYFFNTETRQCESFVWGGCRGSVPFDTAVECMEQCTVDVTPVPEAMEE